MAERSSRAHHAGGDDTGLWEAFGVAFGGDRRFDDLLKIINYGSSWIICINDKKSIKYFKMKKRNVIVIISSFISVCILIVFIFVQFQNPKILNLDVKWIFVSGVPVLLGLILSGIIKSFKGFGIELEINLSDKIEVALLGKVECFFSTTITKDTLEVLTNLTQDQLDKIERLQFITGRNGYYDYYAVNMYINRLRFLKYIEVVDEDGKFQALLFSRIFKVNRNEESIQNSLIKLIKSLENATVSDDFRNAITDTILFNDSIIDAFKKFQKSRTIPTNTNEQILPVLNSNGKMIGVTNRFKLTERIAEFVAKSEK